MVVDMGNDIKCSIITVSYNSASTIERTIKSVLNQTYGNIEYIIVDGNSKDDTVSIIKQYEEPFDGRLKWISEPDDGLYYAMNKGIEMASGELIGIINSDDWYEPDAVEIMIREYEHIRAKGKSEEGLVLYGKLKSWDGNREIKVTMSDHTRLREAMIGHPTCFVSAKTYREHGAFDTRYISAADYDLMLRYSEAGVGFFPVDELIANFSFGGMCASGKAYYDLLKVRKAHKIISLPEYAWIVFKCKMYDCLKGKRGN